MSFYYVEIDLEMSRDRCMHPTSPGLGNSVIQVFQQLVLELKVYSSMLDPL